MKRRLSPCLEMLIKGASGINRGRLTKAAARFPLRYQVLKRPWSRIRAPAPSAQEVVTKLKSLAKARMVVDHQRDADSQNRQRK